MDLFAIKIFSLTEIPTQDVFNMSAQSNRLTICAISESLLLKMHVYACSELCSIIGL